MSKTTQRFIVNEEYLALVPRPTDEEYQSIYNSIYLEGQKDPIVINKKGVILDGHTRYEILTNLGREVEFRVKHFPNKIDERYYVVECNLNRRQLTPFGKVKLAYMLHLDIKKQLKERIRKYSYTGAPDGKHLNWRKELSKKIGVGENWCQQGIYIIEHSTESDNLILSKLLKGSMGIGTAYDMIRAKENHPPRKSKKDYLPTVRMLLEYYKEDQEVVKYLKKLCEQYRRKRKTNSRLG